MHFHVEDFNDGPIGDGQLSWSGNSGVALSVENANNHQLTWGVLGVALQGLMSLMGGGGYGTASFVIFDGSNEVGQGSIGT